MRDILICGASWCGDTKATLRHLDALGVPYTYRDVDTDTDAATWVLAKNGGKRKLPTLDVGGQILSVPDTAELDAALKASKPAP